MQMDGLNLWAVVVTWLIFVVVGAFWYSPKGFGKAWTKLSGVDIMELPGNTANQAIAYVIGASAVQAFVLGVALNSMDVGTALEGLGAAVVLWAGFTAATTIGTTFYSGKGWPLWWLNASFFLVTMAASGLLLGGWQ